MEWDREGEGGRTKGGMQRFGWPWEEKEGRHGRGWRENMWTSQEKKEGWAEKWCYERMESPKAKGKFTERNVDMNEEIFTAAEWTEEGV